MYLKICAAIVLMQISIGTAFAVDDKKLAAGRPSNRNPRRAGGLRAGFNEILPRLIPDTLRVLSCLQEHRKQLRRVCLKVLEDHGQ